MDEFKCEECGCEVSEDDCRFCDDCFDALYEECDEFEEECDEFENDNEGTLQ